MKRLKLRLSRRSPVKLLELADDASACLTGNENFPDVEEEVDAVTTAAGDLAGTRMKIAKVEAVLRTLRSTHGRQVVVLREALDRLRRRVEAQAGGRLLVLQSSGIPLTRDHVPIGRLPQVAKLRVRRATHEGSLYCRWKAVRGATIYQLEVSSSPDGPWHDRVPTSRCWHTLRGLTPGAVYWVRVRAFGTAGFGGYSVPTRCMAA
jgi:hypothetical protein